MGLYRLTLVRWPTGVGRLTYLSGSKTWVNSLRSIANSCGFTVQSQSIRLFRSAH